MTRLPRLLLAAALSGTSLLAGSFLSAYAQNIVTNGSFENPTNTWVNTSSGGNSLPVGSTNIPGWTTTNAELTWDITPNSFGTLASDGAYELDLTGFRDSSPFGGVTQTLSTIAGQKYVLSFDLGVNTSYGSSVGITANIGGVNSMFNFDAPQGGQSWSKRVLTFTATGATTALNLTGSQGVQYIGLDNVSVNALTGTQTLAQSLGLLAGVSNKQKVGTFAGGGQIQPQFGGNGDLVDARYQTRADGSLFAPATGVFAYCNNGATYPVVDGQGDGINQFVGGGGNYDVNSSSFDFAGKATTDTTDPLTIRAGAVVGTFSPNPTRADWFYIGTDSTITAPIGGGDLYLAVNNTNSSDNHGFAAFAALVLCPVCAMAQSDDDVPGEVSAAPESVTLSDAAHDGDIGKVKALLSSGVSINTRFFAKHTALMAASSYGKLEMVRFLLERGADPSLRDAEGRTAAMRAKENGHAAVAASLAKGVVPTKNVAAKKQAVAAPVPAKKQTISPTETSAQPPAPGKEPSDAFLQQLVRNYYRITVNGTTTAPLRVDVRIDRFVREPKMINKVTVVGARVERVNDAAPANAPLYPFTVQITKTEYYNSGASAPETLRWTFDAFNQQAGMVPKGGWVLSSKGPDRGN